MGFKKNNCLFLGKPIVILWQYGTILVIKDFSNKNLSRREYVILSKRMWSQKSQIHDIMSISEREQAKPIHREQRMLITKNHELYS